MRTTICLGTSGYSYDDWVGPWYPAGTAKREMLTYYARRFNAVEVNFTYYRMPTARTLRQMAVKTPEGFRFAIKANSEMTHEREGDPEVFRIFQEALQALIDDGKFGCIRAQFPNSFQPSDESVEYLTWFREQIPSLPTVVEFRNRRWVTADTFDLLETLGLGFCCVDEPSLEGLMPPMSLATADVGYVRFHGRNARQWYEHDEAWQRYNYQYTEQELEEWIGKVRDIADATPETFVFFNNHYQGKAAINAGMFAEMLDLK